MKVVAISDTHYQHDSVIIPECDLLIHAGDVSTRGYQQEVKNFLEWFSKQPAKYKVFIAGNHDFFFDANWRAYTSKGAARHGHMNKTEEEIKTLLANYPDVIYLNDNGVNIEGINIWGVQYNLGSMIGHLIN